MDLYGHGSNGGLSIVYDLRLKHIDSSHHFTCILHYRLFKNTKAYYKIKKFNFKCLYKIKIIYTLFIKN